MPTARELLIAAVGFLTVMSLLATVIRHLFLHLHRQGQSHRQERSEFREELLAREERDRAERKELRTINAALADAIRGLKD